MTGRDVARALGLAAAPLLRRPSKGETWGAWIGYIVAIPVSWWIGMLWLGAVHHEVSARIPALGYWQYAFVYMALSSLGSAVSLGLWKKLDEVTDYLKANSR